MKAVIMMISLSFFFMLMSCSDERDTYKPSSTFTLEIVSIVPQHGYEIDGIPIDYTIQVKGFFPLEKDFQKYNNQFTHSDEYKHIHLSKKTEIHKANGDIIEVKELKQGKTATITFHFINEYNLLATKIVLSDSEIPNSESK